MGQLDGIVPHYEIVEYQGQKLKVSALSIEHITFIARHHGPILTKIYDAGVKGKLSLDVFDVALDIGDEFAPMAGKIIACGLGEPTESDRAAALLPLTVQAELLEKIITLTLTENDGLGKLMRIAAKISENLAKGKSQLFPKP